jgi:hypothetical protein
MRSPRPHGGGPFRVLLPRVSHDRSAHLILSLAVGMHFAAALLLVNLPDIPPLPSIPDAGLDPAEAVLDLVAWNPTSVASGEKASLVLMEPLVSRASRETEFVEDRSSFMSPGDPSEKVVPAGETEGRGASPPAAIRLRPGPKNASLWGQFGHLSVAATTVPADLRNQLGKRIQVSTDSAAVAWTLGVEDGPQWGISAAAIHLGTITIPLRSDGGQIFSRPHGAPGEAMRALAEIQTQRLGIRNELTARAEEIRKASEAKRDSTAGG